MTSGIPGDVNNSVFMTNAYPVGRNFGFVPAAATSFDMRNNMVGELGGLNQDYRGVRATNVSQASTMGGRAAMPVPGNGTETGKKPAIWWITFAVLFIVIAYTARKFAPDGESFAIIKPNLINWLFVTLTVILTMVFLKQIAIRIKKVPFLSSLADLILSV